jgi:rRNA-processing protein EBP2
MNKINNKASEEKEAKKAAELARKQRMNRKYGKKIQIQREQEKQAQVSEDKKKLNTIRKRKRENKDEFDVEVEEEILEKKPKNTTGGKRQKTVSQKRQARNEQYGFGGKNRNDKRNDRESAGKDEFNTARNKAPFRGVKGGRKGKQQRPGKARRQQIRGRKNSKK